MDAVTRDPLRPALGRKRFFEGRVDELLNFLKQPGNSQSKAARFFGCNIRTVELELARIRKKPAACTDGLDTGDDNAADKQDTTGGNQ